MIPEKSQLKRPTFVDPICGMDVDPADSAGSLEYHGTTYYFCSSNCLADFGPENYVDTEFKKRRKQEAELGASTDAVFTCPMHPEIKQVGPGSCPICGMALEPMEISLEDEGSNPELVDFTKRLKVSLVFVIPLLILAMGDDPW